MFGQIARLARPVAARSMALSARVQGGGAEISMNTEQVHAAWVEYFDHADYWDLRRGIREMLTDDAVPTPEIAQVHT